MKIGIVIPARNEQETVAGIVSEVFVAASLLGSVRVVVADNASTDRTSEEACAAGAEVVFVEKRGYGNACLWAVDHLGDWPDVLAFLDADGSSRPAELDRILTPISEGVADLVIGSRPPGASMTFPQKWGTRLAAVLIGLRWGRRFRDIGPFRAVRLESYRLLGMSDRTWGWTVEMQILALQKSLRILEVPVAWDERKGGISKISGTMMGVVRAGSRILWTIGKYSMRRG